MSFVPPEYRQKNRGLCAVLAAFAALCHATAAGAGEWIRADGAEVNRSYVLSRSFACTGAVRRATLRASAAGIGVWRINGSRVGDAYYEPVVSYYEKRIFSRTYDVTSMLSAANTVEVELGGGWWEQNLAWACEGKGSLLGCGHGPPAAWCELDVEYADGGRASVATGKDWSARAGSIVWNNIYGGEINDARVQGRTVPVCIAGDVVGRIEECPVPPCRRLLKLRGKASCLLGEKGDCWIYDFGTNIAGSVALNLPALVPGSRLRVRLAETLTKEGFLDPRSGGSWATHHAPEYVYIAPGRPAPAKWSPEFSYTSFRYAEVSGYEPYPENAKEWGAKPPDDLVEAVMTATDLGKTGRMSCSHVPTMRLVAIAEHTIRCNMHGIPEDCPGREKSGWLGDAQVICPYVLMNFDAAAFYAKFAADIQDGFEVSGKIPYAVPTSRAFPWGDASPVWRAAAVIVPYELYMRFGDADTVRRCYPAAEFAMGLFAADAKDGIVRNGLGDWKPPAGDGRRMPVAHSSTLCWIDCAEKMRRLSGELGLKPSRDYGGIARQTRERFVREFYDSAGHTYGHVGTDAVAWCLGVHPEGDGDRLLASLVKRLRDEGHVMATGIYSSPFLAKALLRGGYGDDLVKCFFNPDAISYQTVIDQGHTTLPELLGDPLRVSREAKGQASLSHPMHAGWLRALAEDVAGIEPLESACRLFAVDPHSCEAYREISAEVPVPSGVIRFRRSADGSIKLSVPPGTRCLFRPTGETLAPGEHVVSCGNN